MQILPDSHYDCKDCDYNFVENYFGDGFMVKNNLWDKYGVGENMLCMDCFEKRMGRKFTAADFTDCPLNGINERIQKIKGLKPKVYDQKV